MVMLAVATRFVRTVVGAVVQEQKNVPVKAQGAVEQLPAIVLLDVIVVRVAPRAKRTNKAA